MEYSQGMEWILTRGTTDLTQNGQVFITPSTLIEPRETELVPDNGPFMKILTGNPSRRPITLAATTAQK